ncbi:hybrid sensor histidine kinase/response regulator [Desulfotomaculum sp. 1211_IL3151]|uniref:hybrid sensor histidine kinase/response regulator n=1 Tax=Desulfotomaculum sp. 1211_IL3151 TaxID=3084055 RepID=UPI002FDB8CD7
MFNYVIERMERNDSNKGKILIVDDEYMHLETAKMYLESAGFEVFCALNTTLAYSIIVQNNPDLILLDVMLSSENGLNILSDIKKGFPNTMVIVMTAFGSEEIAAQALKLGAADYLKKPVKYRELARVIEKTLRKREEILNQEEKVKTLQSAYEKLQVSAESILHCMSSGVVAIDKQLTIQMINQRAADLLKLSKKGVIGKPLYETVPIFNKYHLLRDTLAEEKSIRMCEVEFIDKDDCKIFKVNTDIIYDMRGIKIGAVAVFDDITELKRREKIIKDRERLAIIGQMAAGMAHEIKNPLTAIKGFTQMISAQSPNKKFDTYFDIINSEISRMNQVLQDFLQLAKPKALELKKVNINQIVLEMSQVIEHLVLLKNIRLQINDGENIPSVYIDIGQIKQVLLNLCQNAIEAMQEGGVLTITTSYQLLQREVKLDIQDTGCGIPADKMKEIVVPFYTSKAEGTGLGLSICNTIVDKHKGHIEVQSKVGHGTTFSVFLPVSE